jgi:hypothetical protein
MEILKAIINKIGTPHPVLSTLVVAVLAGLTWFVLLQTFGSPSTESGSPDQTKTPTITNTTTGAASPIITDDHGGIDIKVQQGDYGKQPANQNK